MVLKRQYSVASVGNCRDFHFDISTKLSSDIEFVAQYSGFVKEHLDDIKENLEINRGYFVLVETPELKNFLSTEIGGDLQNRILIQSEISREIEDEGGTLVDVLARHSNSNSAKQKKYLKYSDGRVDGNLGSLGESETAENHSGGLSKSSTYRRMSDSSVGEDWDW